MGTYFNLKKYNIPLELASVSPFSIQIHIIFSHFKAMLRDTYFKNKHGDPLFLCFILIFYDNMILYDFWLYYDF